jgi:pimeloyl-ACP methyl ester carboxylesterase
MHLHNVPDLPEALVAGREALYLGWFYRSYAANPAAIGPDDLAEYVRVYSQPGALRAGFGYYRAIFEDAAFVQAHAQDKLPHPVLAVGGAASLGALAGASYAQVAGNVTAEVFEDCGHWIPEEQPARLAARLEAFLGAGARG